MFDHLFPDLLPWATPDFPPPATPICAPRIDHQASSLSDRLVHLCNHSVQKEQASEVDNGDAAAEGSDHMQNGSQPLPSGSRGNMWRADQLRRHLRQRYEVTCLALSWLL